MKKCEVCGRNADIHHIVHKCQGGMDFPLNYKYLCTEHHRGKDGPHRNWTVDLQYKLQLQIKFENILNKEYYTFEELEQVLELNKSKMKKLLKDIKLYKEGYKNINIIFRLMGNKRYEEWMLEQYDEFIPLYFSV